MKKSDIKDFEASDVQNRLIRSATDQYGHHGTQVSLRAIQREAGVLNEAAIRYYFGSKEKLLDACLASLAAMFVPVAESMIDQYLATKGDEVTVRDVAHVVVGAFYSLKMADEAGIKLIARLFREEGNMGQDLIIKHFGRAIWKIEGQLQNAMPSKPLKIVRLHIFLAMNNTVNGLVDLDLLWRLPAVEEGHEHYYLTEGELASGFIDYITAGMGVEYSKK